MSDQRYSHQLSDEQTNANSSSGSLLSNEYHNRSHVQSYQQPLASSAPSDDASNKRAALTGQWRTPPLPVFPTILTPEQAACRGPLPFSVPPNAAIPVALPSVAELPESTEDYEKALHEAYRRGAEAAAAMAAAQATAGVSAHASPSHVSAAPPVPAPIPSHLGNAISCPDFSAAPPPGSSANQYLYQHHLGVTGGNGVPDPLASSQKSHQHQASSTAYSHIDTSHRHLSHSNTVPMTSIPPHTFNTGAFASPVSASAPQTTVAALGFPSKPNSVHQASPPSTQQKPPSSSPPYVQQRSMSLPDMTSYGAQQDEEKRQKRLARNRASAKLRRLRKKNLVDAYETEVGILEKTLKQLHAHEWGTMDNPRALTEALSMDRGQQVLTAEERRQAANDILQQQLDYLNMLEELLQEQYALQQVRDNPELQDLKEALQLSPEQLDQLANAHSGWNEEWEALQTVKASLQAMKDNDWLWNSGCLSIVEEFMSVLHKNQVSKFLLWADHNVEAIDELDGVNAPSTVPQGPVFHFGVNTNPDSALEEERI